jgi:hypothetical protein
MVSEVGVVCSQQCLDAIKTFQDRISDDVPYRKRHPLLGRGVVRGLMAIAILLAIAYAILCFREGEILMPGDVLDMFAHWGRFLSTYF